MKRNSQRLSLSPGLLGGSVITIVSLLLLLWLLFPSEKLPVGLPGVGVVHDCGSDVTGTIGLIPFSDSRDVRVTIWIDKWKEIGENCDLLEFHFPGHTTTHNYLVLFVPPDNKTAEEFGNLMDKEAFRSLLGFMKLEHDSLLDEDIISLNSKRIPKFSGGIEFIWTNALVQTSFGNLSLSMPIGEVKRPNDTRKSIGEFAVLVNSPVGYVLTSSTPAPDQFRPMGNFTNYRYEFKKGSSGFTVTFANETMVKGKDYLLVVFSALLGIGGTLVAEFLFYTALSKGQKRAESKTASTDFTQGTPKAKRRRHGK